MLIDTESNKKVGLLIGINYINTNAALRGCINDCNNLYKLLTTKFNYPSRNLIRMTDTSISTLKPTKNNIKRQINNLIRRAKATRAKEIWFSFAGHGTQRIDRKEIDKKDEVICPLDYKRSGYISDDWIYRYLVKKTPYNVNLILLMDCCRSGTIADLTYLYKNGKIVRQNNNRIRHNVIKIGGCRDTQTSADARINNIPQGAMTASFIATITNTKEYLTCKELINNMYNYLFNNNFTQIPMLSISKPILLNDKFVQFNQPTVTVQMNIRYSNQYKNCVWNIYDRIRRKYIFNNSIRYTTGSQIQNKNIKLNKGYYKLVVMNGSLNGNIIQKNNDGSHMYLLKFHCKKSTRNSYNFNISI